MLQLTNISISFTETLFSDLTLQFSKGWTGISGANGCGKSSLARMIHDPSLIQTGSITGSRDVIYIEQNPLLIEDEVVDFIYSDENLALKLAGQLGIEYHWAYSIDELSCGQKRKLQLAMALAREPEVLILDEPENHLDYQARQLLIQTLSDFSGVGIIIGHSRDIMNALCSATLLIHQGKTHHYSCGLSEALDLYEANQGFIRKQRTALQKQIKGQKQRLDSLNRNAAKASDALKKNKLDKKDSDSRQKIDMARLTGADKSSGRKVTLQKKDIQRNIENLEQKQADKLMKTGLTIGHTAFNSRRICNLEAQNIQLYPDFALSLPRLEIFPGDHIRITGENGSGKTSLLFYIQNYLQEAPQTSVDIMYCPQELDRNNIDQLFNDVLLLNDKDKGDVLAYFSRLGGEISRSMLTEWNSYESTGSLEENIKMSPGEYKKLFLAYHLLQDHQLLIMDEPVNHLDIFAVRSLEDALSDFPGTLIYVSHEDSFLDARISDNHKKRRWNIAKQTVSED